VEAGRPRVRLTGVLELRSVDLAAPHGLDFFDDDTLLVANRSGGVSLVHLSQRGPGPEPVDGVQGRSMDLGFSLLEEPGSILVTHADGAGAEVLVCNNLGHTVTRHRLCSRSEPVAVASEVLLRRWLDVPDGLAVTADGRWLAVSNHTPQLVLLYERGPDLGQDTDPVAILRGVAYPHGMRFSADGRVLFVADAGAPFIYAFARSGPTWQGVLQPALSLRVMSDETFWRGRHNPQEGGPKGLDLDRTGQVLAVTSDLQPLAFFDVAALVPQPDPEQQMAFELDVLRRTQQTAADLARAWQAAVTAEDARLATVHEAEAARADVRAAEQRTADLEARAAQERAHAVDLAAALEAAQANLAAIEATRTFRALRPLRRAYAAVRARAAHRP
jgi:hypothetical protein